MNAPQLTPLQLLVSVAAVALMFAILMGSIVSWSLWFTKKKHDSIANRPLATVGFIDLLMGVVVLFGLFAMVATLRNFAIRSSVAEKENVVLVSETTGASADAEAVDPGSSVPVTEGPANKVAQSQFLFNGVAMTAQVVCVFVLTAFICFRTGCSLKQLGWRSDRISADLLAGLQCFLMVTPPILVLNAILIQFTQIAYEHPIQKMLEQYPWLLGVAFWLACVVAPISEEFAFRTLLIGWFESIHFSKKRFEDWILGLKIKESVECSATGESVDLPMSLSPSSRTDESELVPSPLVGSGGCDTEKVIHKQAIYQPPWWPAILSGILFGGAHFQYGVSWVNLILLGIVLGRLYQIRQSLLPVILVHFLFNSMGILMFGLKLVLPESSSE